MLADARATAIIPISDRRRSVDFYTDKLGLRLLEETRQDVLLEAGGGTVITMYESVGAGQSRHTLAGFMVDDIEATVRMLRGRGVEFEEYDLAEIKTVNGIAEMEGERAAWFRDPDGNIIGVAQRTAGVPPAA
jgi:catechol 2,3-dioxygenase-like lactoylglutathione lyase family enzyme